MGYEYLVVTEEGSRKLEKPSVGVSVLSYQQRAQAISDLASSHVHELPALAFRLDLLELSDPPKLSAPVHPDTEPLAISQLPGSHDLHRRLILRELHQPQLIQIQVEPRHIVVQVDVAIATDELGRPILDPKGLGGWEGGSDERRKEGGNKNSHSAQIDSI